MMRAFNCLVRIFVLLSAVRAVGAVYYDEGGMPRCLSHAKSASDGLLLFWNTNQIYKRNLYAIPLTALSHLGVHDDYYTLHCREWRRYVAHATEDLLWESLRERVPEGAQRFSAQGQTYVWDADTAARLNQVRQGANVVHEASADKWLQSHPLAEFDRTTNRKLTALYGVGFTADIYKAWLQSLAHNHQLQHEILMNLQTVHAARMPEVLGPFRILIQEGYMQAGPKRRLQPLIDDLKQWSQQVVVLPHDTLATVSENIQSLRSAVATYAGRGEKLLLLSASKGSPEMLGAVALLPPAERQQIAAILNFSGMIEGSFVVDWALQMPQSLFVKSKLAPAAKEVGLQLESLAGFASMSTAQLQIERQQYAPRLPVDIPIYNLIGVISGDGLAKDPEIRLLQTELTMSHLALHGANDGYIEYPGTTFSPQSGLNSYDIVFDASHIVLDGTYSGLKMDDAQQRQQIIAAILSTILSRLR